MGFYNFADGIWGCGFQTRMHARGGNVAYISHSGSGMCGIVDSEERIDFNLVVSTGQELAVSMDEYLDFALEQPSTARRRASSWRPRAIRGPRARASRRRSERSIPIVALKVGRTELSARLTVSHSGAIAGEDAVYDALFDRYGVQRVHDMDELATALIMFAQPHPVGAGGLVSIHDSGGERQLLIDLAHDARRAADAAHAGHDARSSRRCSIRACRAVNPLDAWSTGGPDYHVGMQQCFATLMTDPRRGARRRGPRPRRRRRHPCRLPRLPARRARGFRQARVPRRQPPGHGRRSAGRRGDARGLPGARRRRVRSCAARSACSIIATSRRARAAAPRPCRPQAALARWRARLADGAKLDENDALKLLRDFGLPANPGRIVESEAGARIAAARELGYPVVLKTAVRGIDHKSDRDGVRLDTRGRSGAARPRTRISRSASGRACWSRR